VVVHDTREVLHQGYGVAAVLAKVVAGRGRLLLDPAGLRRAWHRAAHESFPPIKPLPRRKFNGAQRLAYTGVIVMGAGSLATGLAIYKPVQLAWLTTLLGGYAWARWGHFWLTVGYVAFFLIHIAQVARAGWNNFRAMVTGYELARSEEPTYESTR
jgi:thiosulfate reductase cytochrome b subunit